MRGERKLAATQEARSVAPSVASNSASAVSSPNVADTCSRKLETQKYLIAQACAAHAKILAVEISLRRYPELAGQGSLGVRLIMESEDLAVMRHSKN